jgi:uncharacterized protein YcaQ
VRAGRELSLQEARWLAIEAQGLAAPRPAARIERRHLRALIGQIGTVQLDAVNVLQRTQFVVLFSRLGCYDVRRLHDMTGPGGELFEYWGHAASLMPAPTQPLFRWRMQDHAASAAWQARHQSDDSYISAVLEEVDNRGPLAASGLSDPRRRQGEWWDRRSAGRQALEWLFGTGQLAAWRSETFERVYDLPHRVIPASILAAPTPTREAAQRQLLLVAARANGVATSGDLADYFRIRPGEARIRVAELVEAGKLVPVAVEGWPQAAYCLPNARPRRPTRSQGTILSPFDSLIWARERASRLFGFDYRIEVYVPETQRRFGYYVLPLLLGDRLVARLDLKADRKTSTLRVPGAHIEAGADPDAVVTAAVAELDSLRAWLGLGDVAVGNRGDLANALRRAMLSSRRREA